MGGMGGNGFKTGPRQTTAIIKTDPGASSLIL